MSSEDVPDSSSSDDSESDSGSESDDSSSDSPSPPSLPLPVAPDLEDNKHAWNLKNFLPPSHGNSTPAPQTPQVIIFELLPPNSLTNESNILPVYLPSSPVSSVT